MSEARTGWDIFTQNAKQSAFEKICEGKPVYCRLCAEVSRIPTQTLHYCNDCQTGFCPCHGNFSHGVARCMECGYSKKKLAELVSKRFGVSHEAVMNVSNLVAGVRLMTREYGLYRESIPVVEALKGLKYTGFHLESYMTGFTKIVAKIGD